MKISIVVATYNGEKFIEEQLNSLVNQTVMPNEIVISDDNSTDSTVDICRKFKNKSTVEVKIFNNKNYHGVTGNFENAAKNATGNIVFFSDQDDVWYENKIEETLKAFQNYPTCVGVFSNADCVDVNLNKLGATFNDSCWPKFKFLPFKEDMYLLKSEKYLKSAIAGNILGGCCLAIKNHYLKEMFDFCPYTYHDNWLSYCMLALGDAVAINKSLFAYRLHGNNTVGCNNLLSNRKGLYKNFIKFKNRVKNCKKIYVDEAERAIYLKNFADKHNVTNRALDYQQNLVRKKVEAATKSKISGIKMLNTIMSELGQKYTNDHIFQSLYIVLNSKKKRNKDLQKYVDIFIKNLK